MATARIPQDRLRDHPPSLSLSLWLCLAGFVRRQLIAPAGVFVRESRAEGRAHFYTRLAIIKRLRPGLQFVTECHFCFGYSPTPLLHMCGQLQEVCF